MADSPITDIRVKCMEQTDGPLMEAWLALTSADGRVNEFLIGSMTMMLVHEQPAMYTMFQQIMAATAQLIMTKYGGVPKDTVPEYKVVPPGTKLQ